MTSSGTVKTATLGLALRAIGYRVEIHDSFLHVGRPEGADIPAVHAALETIRDSPSASAPDVLTGTENLATEKYHPYFSRDLLLADAVGSRLDFDVLPELARRLTRT